MPLTAGTISLTSKTTTAISLSATEATGGTSPYTHQWYRNTTGSAPVGGDAVSGATGLTLNDTGLTPSTTYFYFLNYADSASAVVQATFSTATNATGALTAGTISLTSKTTTTINLSATEATGGSQPIATRQWYRNTTGAPAAGGDILAGQTGLTLADTGLTPGTTYYYTLNYVDSASTAIGTTFSTATVAITPALSVSPSAVAISSTGTLTLTNPAAHWTTTAPTFTPTGVAGFTLGTVTVTSATTATAPYTAGTTAGTATIAESGAGVTAPLVVSSNAFYLTGVPPGLFASGLTTVGYAVSLNGGAYGSLITVGITEDIPGSYSATFTATPGSVAKVKWTDGAALQAVDYSPQGSPSPVVGGKVAVRLNASDVTGNLPASFNAITGTAISSGIYTMRATSTSSLVHFDAADAIANGLSGAVSRQIEILGGTGVAKGFVGITSVSGSSGSKDGVPNADASGFDATTTYQWAGPIPTKPGDAMGLAPTAFDAITVETGYNAKAALKVALGAIGGVITGNGTALITAGSLPTPTTGSSTVITATMGGTGRTDRTATGIVLSST